MPESGFWREVLTPSRRSETDYIWFLIAVSHGVLGASIAQAMGTLGVAVGLIRVGMPILYWLIKERADLRKGGCVADSVIDTAFMGLGVMHSHPFFAVILLLAAGVGASVRSVLRK